MKKFIGIILVTFCAILLTTGCGKKQKVDKKPEEKGPSINKNENVLKEQTIEEFQFSDISMIYEEGVTKFEATVTNISEQTANLLEFKIHVKDEQGNEMVEPVLVGYIGEQLGAGESRVLNTYSVQDLTSAFSVEYEIVR